MKPRSSNAKSPVKAPAERVVKDIRRQTRRHFSAEDKIRIVLEGLSSASPKNTASSPPAGDMLRPSEANWVDCA